MVDASALSEMQRLLLMAAAVHNLRPGTILTANCHRVVGTALRWAGQLTPEVRSALRDDFEYHPVIRECFAVLIGMVQHEPAVDALLEGAGNFGTPAGPCVMPQFTACRLTPRGERVAEELLARHPGCR